LESKTELTQNFLSIIPDNNYSVLLMLP